MASYIEQFEQLKDKIPEFIVKLYHILQSKEYSDFISWCADEVVIKSGKKLEQKVLPHFFRHKHLSSFIRQLNMYKFSKVNKLTKEKNHMYFRNDYFKRGQIKQMIHIKRNNKKNRGQEVKQERVGNPEDNASEAMQSEVSIHHQLAENNALLSYKQYVKNAIKDITESLKKIEGSFPESKAEIGSALAICNELMEVQDLPTNYTQLNFQDSLQNKNMLSTMRLLPRIESLIFPSQYSFCQFN